MIIKPVLFASTFPKCSRVGDKDFTSSPKKKRSLASLLVGAVGVPLCIALFAIATSSRKVSAMANVLKHPLNTWEVSPAQSLPDIDAIADGKLIGKSTLVSEEVYQNSEQNKNKILSQEESNGLLNGIEEKNQPYTVVLSNNVRRYNISEESSLRGNEKINQDTFIPNDSHPNARDDVVVVSGLASPLLIKYGEKQAIWTNRTKSETLHLIPNPSGFYLTDEGLTSNSTTNFTIPFCLAGKFYGQTNNRILTFARILHRAQRFQTKVGLSPEWSSWVRRYLDLGPYKDKVLFDYYNKSLPIKNPCFRRLKPIQAYRLSNYEIIPELQFILPHRIIRELGEVYVKENFARAETNSVVSGINATNTYIFVSVHRRNFDGVCLRRAFQHRIAPLFCPSVVSKAMCNVTYQDVARAQPPPTTDSSNHQSTSTPIMLFTDGQNPDFDDTFPTRFLSMAWLNEHQRGQRQQQLEPERHQKHPEPPPPAAAAVEQTRIKVSTRFNDANDSSLQMLLEMWIMTYSQIHYGTPESTVDKVLYHWRNYSSMEPSVCFPNVSLSVANAMSQIQNNAS